MTFRRFIPLILLYLTSTSSIYNGTACNPRNYTFLVQLVRYKNGIPTMKCSGTLLELDTVLTAAHCVQKFKKSIFAEPKVVLYTSKGRVEIGTKEIHIHGKYDNVNLQYDIAILKLEEPFTSSEATTVSLAPKEDSRNSTPCSSGTFLGWGRTKIDGTEKFSVPSVNSLRCIDLPVMPLEDCRSLRSLDKLDTFFCVFSGFDAVGGGCFGDSGGPFLCSGVQYGVASVSFGCGVRGEPTFFTRIDKTLSFIEGHVRSSAISGNRGKETCILSGCLFITLIIIRFKKI